MTTTQTQSGAAKAPKKGSKSSKGKGAAEAPAETSDALATAEPTDQLAMLEAGIDAGALLAEFEAEGGQAVRPEVVYHRFTTENHGEGVVTLVTGILLQHGTARDPFATDEAKRAGTDTRDFYIMALTAPTIVYTAEGEKRAGVRGEFVWLNSRHCLNALKGYLPVYDTLEDGRRVYKSVSEVLVIPTRQKEIDGGRKVWRAKIAARTVSPQAVAQEGIPLIAPPAPAPPIQDDEDAPF